eukprot:scaffold92057_cov33-Tisochrysis_lutea.AAC.2
MGAPLISALGAPRAAALVLAAAALLLGPRLLSPPSDVPSPPPRLRLSRPFLDEAALVLAAVHTSSRGVPAQSFLMASYSIITIFDSLPGMGVVKADMLGNADALWRLANPADTLEEMCDRELESFGGMDKHVAARRAAHTDGSACTSLLWLKYAHGPVHSLAASRLCLL